MGRCGACFRLWRQGTAALRARQPPHDCRPCKAPGRNSLPCRHHAAPTCYLPLLHTNTVSCAIPWCLQSQLLSPSTASTSDTPASTSPEVTQLARAPSGRQLAAGYADGSVRNSLGGVSLLPTHYQYNGLMVASA